MSVLCSVWPLAARLLSLVRDTLYFDGQCGMCRTSCRWLARLDWFDRLAFADMTVARDLPVDLATAMRGIPMRTVQGQALVGFEAVRRALVQTPMGVAPALLLYLPGVAGIGRMVYGRIAASRQRTAACRVS